jgi:hypothetical protein
MATPNNKAVPKASTKKGASRTSSQKSPADQSKVCHKFDGILNLLRPKFPEIVDDDTNCTLLINELHRALPESNMAFAYSKASKDLGTLRSRLVGGLSLWHLSEPSESAGFTEFLVDEIMSGLSFLYRAPGPVASAELPSYLRPVVLPVPQRKDEELIRSFVTEPRDEEVIDELEKRSKGMAFLASSGPNASDCDVLLSCELLKNARKGQMNPERLEGKTVYTIAQMDLKNRVRHECPLCTGVALVRDVCPVCDHDFSGVGKEDRVRIRLAIRKLGTPKAGQTPSSVTYQVNAFKAITSTFELLSTARMQLAGSTLEEELAVAGLLPTLLLVDSPQPAFSPQELRRVDAFHRATGGAV